ncbi:MAG: hypothetical protein BECKG1743D_GA0114223_100292 [Candidatus Kentron sp. G]|nr:MAG: hypothetical protein BECKG1743D_GA0114223_100292 [Candidatus Kentron sp. G]VFN02627.1 MAG: hypothetical protein BECKG1743F_GA0114225_107042 [Candidatus Kentron sp. G]VFN04767.1 MAG: hypothetical protein BECKG1743E_GA0114224_107742 [Candidatus Kentron sp. G]
MLVSALREPHQFYRRPLSIGALLAGDPIFDAVLPALSVSRLGFGEALAGIRAWRP